MRCLCCGGVIDQNSKNELQMRWHEHCVKSFFGIATLPKLMLEKAKLEQLASVNVDEGLAIPGVQKKISLHLEKAAPSRLTLVDYPTGYILKPQTDEYAYLPEYEWLAMRLASLARVKVVPFALYDTGEDLVYLTKRIDRQFNADEAATRYAMEDFCQLTERLAEDKYKGSYEACVRVVRQYSETPGLDASEIFLRVVVSYVVGNSDLHLKNFSLKEFTAGGREYGLSEAYDILPVNVVEPRDLDEMALSLNGKKRELELADFLEFARYCDLGGSAGEKIIQSVCALEDTFAQAVQESFLSPESKEQMSQLIHTRCQRLRG